MEGADRGGGVEEGIGGGEGGEEETRAIVCRRQHGDRKLEWRPKISKSSVGEAIVSWSVLRLTI